MNSTRHALTLAVTALLAGSAHAGVVASWGTPVAISSNLDIVNPTGVIHAVDFTDEPIVANTIVNVGGTNVTFNPNGVVGGSGFKHDSFFVDNNTDDGAATVSGDTSTEFHSVLDGFRDNSASRYTFTGLAAGTYNLQAFHSDDRGARTSTWLIATDYGQISEEIHATIQFTDGSDTFFSSYVNATVTLTGGDDSFQIVRTQGQINAAVLTSAAIPEPGSLALMGLGGLCVLRRRRA